eukprot:TRINITY_DN29760_c0_g1_i1.p1 TRINITY_DN29760_c0_g1~~TRINITY_DN29760_c0_g1_i1.p1  ORF type:complete len:238 (+),score=36.36 TRINITY_DN29760_c0_g1_i1:107-820(+)
MQRRHLDSSGMAVRRRRKKKDLMLTDEIHRINKQAHSILVSFRGTDPHLIQNWIVDLNIARQADYPGVPNARVHDGWYNAYKKLAPKTRSLFKQAMTSCPSCTIEFTGHSLGAALMGVCVLDLLEQNILSDNTPATVINFGMPRLGNKGLTEYWNNRTTAFPIMQRVVNWHDIVPRLPPKDLPMGWWHFPTEVWDNWDAKKYIVCDGSGEDPHCSDSVIGDSIYDHLHYFGYGAGCA